MRAIVLGSAAGGSFPQWNCGCPNCVAVREKRPGFEARTQDSVAVTHDGARFALLNASPDVLAQIQKTPALWPRSPRHSPIACVVLTNGDMDHVLGLFSLRESQPFVVYATNTVWRGLEQSLFLRTLQRFEGHTVFRPLPLDETIALADVTGAPLGLHLRAVPTPGKPPVHLMGKVTPSDEDAVALVVRSEGSPSLAYATACASADIPLVREEHGALLFDGTFYREDELVRLGLSKALAKSMAHVPIESSLGLVTKARKIYAHVNNTNPILDPSSEERRAVLAAGWEIATDGMEITL